MRAATVACLILGACSQADAGTPWERGQEAAKAPHTPSQKVRVIDGDTFVLDGETIRIENIDAPESGKRAKCVAEAVLADKATSALTDIVWRPLTLTRSGRDRWGRTLARVAVRTPSGSENDVGEIMVTAGFAAEWRGHRWDWCGPGGLSEPGGPVGVR
jgi:micrococcal nuclease